MFQWFAESGYQADIPTLRRLHPNTLPLEAFLRRRAKPADA
ncbi:hypothetical protein [Streptomyces iconiensis]|uniref:Uncharacterized protein n=1 Tax=Streptomyces iconiensis TaxID=1384038 RepID=A0ABT7A3N7_9ACTN|nr:hypothetical protein [Streptomyces iconiensis]MDJ1135906.1 hypothetical protein [Streptomyces iconiensis]